MTYGGLGAMRKAWIGLIFMIFLASGAAADKLRILAFGDSLTAGYGLESGQGLVPVLQTWLDAQGAEVEIVQGGVSGDTTSGGLARLDWVLSDAVQGIILELGANDMLRGVAPELARANLSKMIEIAQARELEVLLVAIPVAANFGADYKRDFEAIWPDLAEQYGVTLYPDFMAGLGETPTEALQHMQGDAIHPNAEGVKRIVERLGPQVRALAERIRAE
ncbi:arylesterase [Rhodobacteraceae bacterium D3-12]|nr:arylesterase [Rhodobacteraceae bacterium D3-12]